MTKRRIIIDCDPGVDDTIELLIALGSPELEIIGITTVAGNVSAEQTQINARGILALAKRNVPVVAGDATPLSGALDQSIVDRGTLIHGKSGIEGLVLPDMTPSTDPRTAADFIIEQLRTAPPKTITLVATGAQTNLAIVFQTAPDVIERIDRIVLMGGAFGNPGGNVKPYAEFNMNVDPLAASIVFDHAPSIVAFPLDITHQTTYDRTIRNRIRAIDPVFGPNIATMLDRCAATYPEFKDNDEAPLHDPHTIAYLLKPDLYEMKRGRVSVHSDGPFAGKTEFIADTDGNVQIPASVDAKAFFELVIDRLIRCASAAGYL